MSNESGKTCKTKTQFGLQELLTWMIPIGCILGLQIFLSNHFVSQIAGLISVVVCIGVKRWMPSRESKLELVGFLAIAIVAGIAMGFVSELLLVSFGRPSIPESISITEEFGLAFRKVFWSGVIILTAFVAAGVCYISVWIGNRKRPR